MAINGLGRIDRDGIYNGSPSMSRAGIMELMLMAAQISVRLGNHAYSMLCRDHAHYTPSKVHLQVSTLSRTAGAPGTLSKRLFELLK